MTLRIVAVDPGKTTGVAIWDEATNTFTSYEFNVNDFYTFITDEINDFYSPDTNEYELRIVSEDFIITVNTAKNSQAHWSLRLIGVMDYLCQINELPALTLQAPALKAFGSDSKLKMVDWWKSGLGGHANDAARHLMIYAATRKLIFDTETLKRMAQL